MAKLGVIYAPKARKDIATILQRSAEEWGFQQVAVYAAQIEKALNHLREYPDTGQIHPSLRGRQRIYHVGSHRIVYSVRSGSLHVARILHQKMSLPKHL